MQIERKIDMHYADRKKDRRIEIKIDGLKDRRIEIKIYCQLK